MASNFSVPPRKQPHPTVNDCNENSFPPYLCNLDSRITSPQDVSGQKVLKTLEL